MSRVAVISPFSRPAEAEASLAGDPPVTCHEARGAEELALHFEIRRRVFVEEQGFFAGSDRDAHDEEAATIHVLGLCGNVAGGAVRLYPLEQTGRWKGDRLAVLPLFRRHGLGAPLVHFAVATAGELGGREMIAHVQLRNVPFFERLGWRPMGEPVEYVGRPHQVMVIGLGRLAC